jgi:hypothetical protein
MPFRFALLFLLLSISAHAQVPTPESVLGHKPGDDFYLASYDDALLYFRKLAASSDRIKLISVGKSSRGVDWEVALISSPQNLAQFDHYKDISRRLAQARGLTDDAAHALAREGKAIVHIDGGLHSTEVAGGQHSIQLAYNLLSAKNDPEIDNILDNVILVLWFSLNPDGQNIVVNWYRRNVGTPYEVSPLPELYQEYVGHDNNRDGYMNNMPESQIVTRAEIDFNAVVFYCQHQTAPFPARIWIPPYAEPISGNVNPIILRWLNVYGTNMSAYLEDHGMPGAIHQGNGFDNWYPGFLDYTHIFRNTMAFFTETALYAYATPHFYTVDDFPKDRQDLRSEVLYSSPWKGGWWHLNDAVRYMLGGSMSVLNTSAKWRETLLYNRYQAGRDTIARFTNEPPYAYVIPAEQRDLPTAGILIDKLLINGLEVSQATRPFRMNGIEYKAGSWVILMNQPFAALAKELLEVQHYPDMRQPYDVAGWTLPMQMDVETITVTEPIEPASLEALQRIDKVTLAPAAITGKGSTFLLPHRINASAHAVNDILAAGGTVRFANKDDIAVSGVARDRVDAIAAKYTVPATASDTAPTGLPVTKPRVGLYRPWAASIDEGWTRWIFENFGFAPISVRNADFQGGHLRSRFDVIVLPDVSQRLILEGFKPGTVPGQYAGGVEESGIEAIRDFIREGGTLVAFNNSSQFAIDQFKLPVENVVAGLKNEQFFCSGSLLKVEIKDANHPVTYGMPAEPIVMFERGPAFDTKSGFQGTIIASYPKDRNPLMSGYLLHPERIQGKAALLDVNYGKGHIILMGFRPQWRAQSHGTYKFIFNSLYYSGPQTVAFAKPATAAAKAPDSWRGIVDGLHADLAKLLDQNHAFFAAKGPAAAEEGPKLDAALQQFRTTRLGEIEDYRAGIEDRRAVRKIGDYETQWRLLLRDLKAKEVTGAPEAVLDQYRLTSLEKDINP